MLTARHHEIIERWSRGASVLHSREARAKLVVLLVTLVAISTTPADRQIVFIGFAGLFVATAFVSRLPLVPLIARAALVLPFSAMFAILTWWAGDTLRAVALVEKSYLSGFAALLFVATTPLTKWTAALEACYVPKQLVLIAQFVYRYLFVIADQAEQMRLARLCRGGSRRFSAATGTVSVLFARSWERSEGIDQAMRARGFRGSFAMSPPVPLNRADAMFLFAGVAASLTVRLAL